MVTVFVVLLWFLWDISHIDFAGVFMAKSKIATLHKWAAPSAISDPLGITCGSFGASGGVLMEPKWSQKEAQWRPHDASGAKKVPRWCQKDRILVTVLALLTALR